MTDTRAMAGFGCQRGLALITAVFVVAIVSTVAAYMALGQQIWIRQAQNFADRAQGDAVARGAANYALMVLRDDQRKHPDVDDYSESWAKPIATPVEGGVGAGQIVDAQARFNLNNLHTSGAAPGTPPGSTPGGAPAGTTSNAHVLVFNNLLRELKLDPGITDAIIDWIDDDQNALSNGAEDNYYLTLDPPYRTADQKLASVGELRLIKGIDAKTFEALAPYVVALPDTTTINVNTADPVLLAALYPSAPGNLKQVAASRKDNPFDDMTEFGSRVAPVPANTKNAADVKSSHFLLEVQTKFGRVSRGGRVLIKRDGGNKTAQLAWQEQILPLPARPAP